MEPHNLAFHESLNKPYCPVLLQFIWGEFIFKGVFNKDLQYKSATPMKLNSIAKAGLKTFKIYNS
ncbi:MAG TPA: hypothetical protein DCQ15_00240 [Chitinophagaceae bacterium]|jgi:hypothetical protein|nr:hypothetical protein [Chitinophagaceae bacterium]